MIFKLKEIGDLLQRGHADNLGIYSNLGFKLNDETIFSAHLRGDSHKYSEENLTYRLNLTKIFNNFTFSLSESTGLRHPDLFALHGTNPSGSYKSMKTTKAETSLTRELSTRYNFAENIFFESTAYKIQFLMFSIEELQQTLIMR